MAINNDTIGCGEEEGGGGAPAINNDTVSRGEQVNDKNQQLIKLQSEEIKELKRKLYEQQQLQSRDGNIRILESNVQIYEQQQLQSRYEKLLILESNVQIMRQEINNIFEHMRDQPMSGVHMDVSSIESSSTITRSSSSINSR